jgi:Icc-related predicted phosphoesterase
MRVHVVSDVHGRADALAGAGRGADALICLGDLLLFLDYADHTRGIFADLFGPDQAREYIDLRTAKRFDEARALSARLFAQQSNPATLFEKAIQEQYAELFRALPEPAYLTYGNVDVPRMWAGYLKPGHTVIDGGTVELDGWRVTGEVDVLCTHIPPAIPELLYDTVARRLEQGSVALLDMIKRTQPRYALFGHVHQPLVRRTRIGNTECLNVGHFRATGAPHVLQW